MRKEASSPLMRWLFTMLCAAVCGVALADGTKVEQLLHQFNEVQGGKTPTAQTISVANSFLKELQAMEFFDDPIQFTAKDGADTLRQQVWYWAAEWYYDRQQYDVAADYAKKALPLFHIPSEQADCMSLTSLCHFRQGDYDTAARYAKQCYEIDVAAGDADRISSSLNTLAGIYMAARQPREAERYILKGIEYAAQVDNPARRAVLYGKASEVYHQLGDDQRSLDYARQAYGVERTLGREDKLAIRLSQMASAYIGLGQHAAARDTLRRAIPLLEAADNRQQLGICCNQMGLLLLGEHHPQEAADYFERARRLFYELGDRYNESTSLDGLAKALRDTDPAAALRHMERCNALKDSIYDHETGELLTQYAAQYGYEQLQEQSAAERHARHLTLIFAVVAILVLILLALVLLIFIRRRALRQHLVLQQRLDQMQTHLNRLNASNADTSAEDELSAADRQFLSRTLSIINTQIDNGSVNVDTVASQLNMSTSVFRRRLTSLTGETPKNYIQAIRMQKARHLFDTQPDLTISEVALRCGYDEASNFTRSFKRHYGMTPTEYQNDHSTPKSFPYAHFDRN